ncbi:MAG: hypothetical protein NXY57DRAFT_964911 [Lentinula lateritia]|nr:MAG: hypothetical protein NXY57DRAFT_964911 [Lentinula lateritia]
MTDISATVYEPSIYNGLLTIEEASAELKQCNAVQTINEKLAGILIEYRVSNILGIQLLHRHFMLAETEQLVGTNGTFIPWGTANIVFVSAGKVFPSAWAFKEGGTYPFEFQYSQKSVDLFPVLQTAGFLLAFYSALHKAGLLDILGVGLIDVDAAATIECTIGCANIVVPCPDNDTSPVVPTFWVAQVDGARVKVVCTQVCGYDTKTGTRHVDSRHDK